MAQGAIETITADIKERYKTGVWQTMQNRVAKYRAALKKQEDTKLDSGGSIRWPVRLASSWNVGSRADLASFPTPYDNQRLQAYMTPVLFTGTMQVGLKSHYALRDEKSSFSNGGITADLIEETAEDVTKYINMVYAGSVLGRLGTTEADGTSTITMAKPQGVTLLRERMVIEALSALTGGSVVDSFSAHRITAINEDTRVVDYVLASSGAADDRSVTAGSHIFLDGTYGQLPFSLRHIVDNGDDSTAEVFNLSRTTYPKLKAQIFGNGGVLRDLDEQLLLRAIDAPERRTGKRVTRALANSGQGRKYVEFAAADRRYPGATKGTQNYSLGYGENSLQIVAPGVNCTLELERDVHPRSVYLLAWDTFFLAEMRELDWFDEGALLHLVPGSAVHAAGVNAYICSVENQGCTMPPANARIDDLKDDLLGDV